MILRAAAAIVAALAVAAPAASACTPKTSLAYLEGQVMCPTCHTTLDQSDAPAAKRIEAQISKRVGQCWTADEIKTELVANFGAGILAAPPRKGFDLVAWWLPIVGVIAGAAVLAFGVWRWSRDRDDGEAPPPAGGDGLDPESAQRLDEALARFE